MDIEKELSSNELRKAGLLLAKAGELGMDLSGFGEVGLNRNSGNVYLWLEDYPFCLYIGLGNDDIMACWSNPEDGEEEITETDGLNLDLLNDWAYTLQEESEAA